MSCTIWNVKHLLCKCLGIRIITDLFMEINSASSDLPCEFRSRQEFILSIRVIRTPLRVSKQYIVIR